jgi:capsular polysaccharide biosynthesis protein
MTDIALYVPSPQDVIARSGIVTLQEKSLWSANPPSLVVNLSRDLIQPDFNAVEQSAHATYVGTYENHYLFGFHHLHALVSSEGEFNCQEVDNYKGRIDFHLSHLPPKSHVIPDIRAYDSTTYRISFDRLLQQHPIPLPGYTFFGSPIEPENWGMWLLNGLYSAFSYVAAGQPGRFLCYAPNPWQQNLLNMIGVKGDRIVQQLPWSTYHCEQVSLHQYSRVDLVPDRISLALFQNISHRFRGPSRGRSNEKIFLSRLSITRKLGGYRALANEEQLIAALEQQGYVTIEPEKLPFDEQVAVFSDAKIVVGLGGAAMFNTVFCKAGTRVLSIESTAAFALNHARLFAALGHRYGFIFGQQNTSENRFPHNSWSIDIEAAVRAVVSFE